MNYSVTSMNYFLTTNDPVANMNYFVKLYVRNVFMRARNGGTHTGPHYL